jgi:hypothetical protein
MSDRLEDDLLEDLGGEPEGRSHAMDEFDDPAEFDEFDDSMDDLGDPFDSDNMMDEFEDVVADALGADDVDEFWGKIGGFLKKVGRGVGNVARVVAPIANMIPLPQAQAIGRIANVVGKVLADEGDEMDALDELADYADDDEAMDALAPAVAGLAIRSAVKNVARLPHPQRKQLVQAVTAATRHVARTHGPRVAAATAPGIVHHARRMAVRQGLPASRLPQLVKRTAAAAVRSPQAVRKLARTATALRSSSMPTRRLRRRGGMGGVGGMGGTALGTSGAARRGAAAACPHCGRRRSWQMHGPVRLTIESI